VLPVYPPMLATRWASVTDESGWAHEIKWDGVRAVAAGDGSIRSRNGNRIEAGYPELTDRIPADVVLDGEIVALDATGRPSFQRLQSRMHVRRPGSELLATVPVTLVVFDLLHQGASLIDLPWKERRRRLESLDLPSPLVVSSIHDDGPALFAAVVDHGLEGVVSKRTSSPYRPGRRSEDWRKVTHRRTCEAVVIGAVGGTGGRASTFGSLALGLWVGTRLRFVGSVGSGFDQAAIRAIDAALDQIEIPEPPPLEDIDPIPTPIRWVEPVLVAVVEYASWTDDGRLRAPAFKGFSGSPAADVTWEREGPG
jgi:bifunctional non-homologous end joining protein LigD